MSTDPLHAVVIGGGPAGLMAADVLSAGGARVDLYDAMPSVGRKFLLAGKGGLNLTHSEAFEPFLQRYGAARAAVEPMLRRFGPAELRDWARDLGIATFVGSSGRVFPVDLKAAPLLRAWLHRLRGAGVRFHMRRRWLGWDAGGRLRLHGADGEETLQPDVVVLALGGASWSRLGSDGAWVPWLVARGVSVAPLVASNCGFDVTRPGAEPAGGWSSHFRSRFAGQPVKNVAMALDGPMQPGEFVVTEGGVEGSLVYALSGPARAAIAAHGEARVCIDLLPQRSAEVVHAEVARPRGARSLSTHLKSRLGLDGVKAGLLRELLPAAVFHDPAGLAAAIKRLPLTWAAPRPIDEAISSAGGVRFESLDDHSMLRAVPGVFCAGEMLDWDAPTGGYLMTACLASGLAAGHGALGHLHRGGVLHPAPGSGPDTGAGRPTGARAAGA